MQRIRLDALTGWEVYDGYTLTRTWLEGETKLFRFTFRKRFENDAVNGRRLIGYLKSITQGSWGDPASWEVVEEAEDACCVSYRHADRDGEFSTYPWSHWPFITPGGLSGMTFQDSFVVYYYDERWDELWVEGDTKLFEEVTKVFGDFPPTGTAGHYHC